ncbi:MAG: hypothetical protein IAF38_10275, partial [Bacteroidia bacterium]|nr:hypothetical protein [Bacteroidia bacterium]
KTIVEPTYNYIGEYCDKFFVADLNGKGQLCKINGKVLYTFVSEIKESEILPSGSLVVIDSVAFYLFDNSLSLVETIPYKKDLPKFEAIKNVFVFFAPVQKDSLTLYRATVRNSSTFKTVGTSYLLESADDFDEERTWKGRRRTYFKVKAINEKKPALSNQRLCELDSSGNLIFERTRTDGEDIGDWFETKQNRLYRADDYKRLHELINEYYTKGKADVSNIKYLSSMRNNKGEKQYSLRAFNGDVLKTFAAGTDIRPKTINRSDEVLYFRYTIEDTVADNDREFFMNTEFEIVGDEELWFEPTDKSYDNHESPDDESLAFYVKNKQACLYSLTEKKEILSFIPDEQNVFNSKGTLPVSGAFEEEFFAYKEGEQFGLFYFKTGVKKELFRYSLPSGKKFNSIDFDFSEWKKIMEVEFELVSTDTTDKRTTDTAFSFLRKSNGEFLSMANLKLDVVFPLFAYDSVYGEPSNFNLPFYSLRHSVGRDSLTIIDRNGKIILKENKKLLYWVGKKFIGLSNGKTSSLFNAELKELSSNIPGIVCATVDEKGKELICKDGGVYYSYKSEKKKKLFTENELMGWPVAYVNNPDSDNYKESYPIVHAEKQGNKLLLYQRISNEYMFRLALYDFENGKLATCPYQTYTDGNSDNEMSTMEQFEMRFRFLRKNTDSATCFSAFFKPGFILDTLDFYSGNDDQFQLISDQYKNFHLFTSRKNPVQNYFGTFDSIYYKFNDSPNAENWDCEVIYFGNSEGEFYLVDPVTHKLSANRYKGINVDLENGCDKGNFAATNLSTNRQELFEITATGQRKIFEGTFSQFQRVNSYDDGLGRSKTYFIFSDQNSRILFHTDEKFNLLYDTTRFMLAPEAEPYYLWEGGANSLILKDKKTAEFFLLNGITGITHKIASGKVEYEDYGGMHLLLVANPDEAKSNLKDLILGETGEIIKDYDYGADWEWFIFNNKLYYKVNHEEGGYSIFNSKKEKIK